MAKKHDSNGQLPLSHYWIPPEKLEGSSDSGGGDPRACLATTFEFDPAFFEEELLPRFLGLKFDQTENEPSFIVEREVKLAESVRVAVLVDASRFNSGQTTLRWDQVSIRVPGGLLHAKITVLCWDRLVRVLMGSANLMREGYRRNREVFAALDFWDGGKSVPLSLLYEVLDLLAISLEWACAAPAVRDRTHGMIGEIRQMARRWKEPREFKARERPRVTLAITHPRTARSGARSALGDVLTTWATRRATSVGVVTPFVGQDLLTGNRDRVIDRLVEVPQTRDCRGYLVVPELPQNLTDEVSRVGVPKAFGRSWAEAFTSSRAFVLPLPLCVQHVEARNRALHTKAILLESKDDALLMVGSSNFTPHGMGIGVFNLEANLVFLDRMDEKRDGVFLSDRLGLPLDWDDAQSVDDLIWQDPVQPPEDMPASDASPPPFFAWATYSQVTGELTLGLDLAWPEPIAWAASLLGDSGANVLVVFSRDRQAKPLATSTLGYTIAEQARGVSIVAMVIDWTDVEGKWHSAKLGVCAESVDSLLPPSEFRELGADAIIECLISRKSPSQWYDQQQRAIGRRVNNDAAVDSLRAVDTSGYLLYRVRRFGRALTAMRAQSATGCSRIRLAPCRWLRVFWKLGQMPGWAVTRGLPPNTAFFSWRSSS